MARQAGRRCRGRPQQFFDEIAGEFGGFAAFQFSLSAPQADGAPLREHLAAYEEKTGKPHPAIAEGPALPQGCEALWSHFLELHDARGSNGFGPSKIGFRDLSDWQGFTGIRLAGWHVAAIRKADDAFIADWAERQPKGEDK